MKTEQEALLQIKKLALSIKTGQLIMPQGQLAQTIIDIIKETED